MVAISSISRRCYYKWGKLGAGGRGKTTAREKPNSSSPAQRALVSGLLPRNNSLSIPYVSANDSIGGDGGDGDDDLVFVIA